MAHVSSEHSLTSARMRSIETRVTEWVECEDGPWYPNMGHGGFVSYRIWQKFDGMSWMQMHEWERADGTKEMQSWIPGVKDWLPGSLLADING